MKHEKFDTLAYRNQIQEQFSGANGNSGWENFGGAGAPELNANGMAPEMNANGIPDNADNTAPELNFTIQNTSTTANATCVLFGASLFLSDPYNGSSSTIVITPDFGVGYGQVLRDTSTAPFTLGQVRMQCAANAAQVTQGLSVVSTNIYGDSSTKSINMVTNISEYQQQLTIARSTRAFDITSDVYFKFLVLPSTTLTCTVYIKNKVNIARQLAGQAISGMYAAPNNGIKPLYAPAGYNGSGSILQLGK